MATKVSGTVDLLAFLAVSWPVGLDAPPVCPAPSITFTPPHTPFPSTFAHFPYSVPCPHLLLSHRGPVPLCMPVPSQCSHLGSGRGILEATMHGAWHPARRDPGGICHRGARSQGCVLLSSGRRSLYPARGAAGSGAEGDQQHQDLSLRQPIQPGEYLHRRQG